MRDRTDNADPAAPSPWLTFDETARLLHIAPELLFTWGRRSFGPTRYKIGTKIRYRRDEVERMKGELADGPVDCEPWCEDGNGHTKMRWRSDQQCCGQVRSVYLSLEKPIANEDRDVLDDPDDTFAAAFRLDVQPWRDPDGKLSVELSANGLGGFSLTPEEAFELSSAVFKVLTEIGHQP